MKSTTTLSAFPQPTRPINSYNSDSSSQILPSTSYPYDGQCFRANYEQVPEITTTMKLDEENETVEELVYKINDLYQKLPENIKSQVKFDINVPSEMMRELKVASNKSRNIEGSSSQELSRKLQRFKIRTVQVGDIVTDDETNQDVK